ncbi:MAG: PDZ domain-containing protein [Planctomycetota bacterium]
MNDSEFENPVLGYVVITVGLILGLMTASVLGSAPIPAQDAPQVPQDAREVSQAISPEPSERQAEPRAARRWILGVRVKATFTGCLVQEVVPGSPAKKAGLSTGDRILCVAGRQVGWVDSRRVALDRTLDRLPNAATHLLAQKASTGRIVTIAVRLQTLHEALGH